MNKIIAHFKRADRQLHRKYSRRIAYFSVTIAIVCGIGKELYDLIRKDGSGWDWWDLAADLWGICEGFIVRLFIVIIAYSEIKLLNIAP